MIEPLVNELELQRLKVKVRALDEAETQLARFTKMAGELRAELGEVLAEKRKLWPERGPNAKGWGEFLASIGLSQQRAWELIRDFTDPVKTVDRDSWCTPKWLTDALGSFDLDPCANERSHVSAKRSFQMVRGEDGLKLAAGIKKNARVFINPPYSDVMPWVEAYAHTRFCFLLKVDASTKWFARLHEITQLICVPRGTRIEFEAPPDVDSSSNQFPHGLFFAREGDASKAVRKLSYVWRIVR
jgi:hypothetical protein